MTHPTEGEGRDQSYSILRAPITTPASPGAPMQSQTSCVGCGCSIKGPQPGSAHSPTPPCSNCHDVLGSFTWSFHVLPGGI